MPGGIHHHLSITFTLTNDAQELMLYKFEFKPDTNVIRKDFVYAWFEPRSLGRTSDTLPNSASPLLMLDYFGFCGLRGSVLFV
jgi:hypothetical protein